MSEHPQLVGHFDTVHTENVVKASTRNKATLLSILDLYIQFTWPSCKKIYCTLRFFFSFFLPLPKIALAAPCLWITFYCCLHFTPGIFLLLIPMPDSSVFSRRSWQSWWIYWVSMLVSYLCISRRFYFDDLITGCLPGQLWRCGHSSDKPIVPNKHTHAHACTRIHTNNSKRMRTLF